MKDRFENSHILPFFVFFVTFVVKTFVSYRKKGRP
jgi:hypothetical protein